MGVMPCERNGCDNILCDRILTLTDGERYICRDCLGELEDLKEKVWPSKMRESEMNERIEKFMNEKSDPERETDELFDSFFR